MTIEQMLNNLHTLALQTAQTKPLPPKPKK